MFGFDPKNIRDFSDFRLSAIIIFIIIWNILLLLEFAYVLKWDMENINKLLLDELDIRLSGLGVLALFMAFVASLLAQKSKAFQKILLKPEASIEDSLDTLKFVSLILGLMSIGFLVFTLVSNI